MALKKWLDRLTLLDLFVGLSVTGRHLFKKKVTIQYPEQKKLPSDRFRGMFRLDSSCAELVILIEGTPTRAASTLSWQLFENWDSH